MIPDILNLICSYLSGPFDPKESYKLFKINPKFYKTYHQDLLNFNITIFNEIYERIYLCSASFVLNYNKTSICCGLKSKLVPIYRFDIYFKTISNLYKKYNLEMPIQKLVKYEKDTLIFTKDNQNYSIKLENDALILGKQNIPYYELTFFWKLIYITMYIFSEGGFPYHLHEKF